MYNKVNCENPYSGNTICLNSIIQLCKEREDVSRK